MILKISKLTCMLLLFELTHKELTLTLQGKSHLCIPFLGIAWPQFHFWEYINGNQTFLLDSHRPFICSVQYIAHTNRELTLMLSIRQELKLMLSIWIRNLSEYRHKEFKQMLSVLIRSLCVRWAYRKHQEPMRALSIRTRNLSVCWVCTSETKARGYLYFYSILDQEVYLGNRNNCCAY